MKYIIEVKKGQQMTAGSKAKEDIVYFLKKENFLPLNVKIPNSKIVRLLKGRQLWRDALVDVKEGDFIIYQYPAYSRISGELFVGLAKKTKKILIIHDLDSMRQYRNSDWDKKREIRFINSFDTIIAHNPKMKEWLQNHNVSRPIITLDLFDYHEDNLIKESRKEDPLVFAGNLSKSTFLEKLSIDMPVNLYGIDPASSYKKNINYLGAFLPEDLGDKIHGNFGLVWDGDSLEKCSGVIGEYMMYNNPHKTSLYLSLGLPVIIWNQAALASFVIKHKVGLVIENLESLDSTLKNISENEYQEMKKNAKLISQKVRNGYFVTAAVKKAMKTLMEE